MSVLHIPDDVLRRLGSSDRDALTEIACRLYETYRFKFDEAARLADVDLDTGRSLRFAEDPRVLVSIRRSRI